MSEWQPIENAPMDMGEVDIWVPGIGRMENCVWSKGRGCWIRRITHGVQELFASPTHWMPLPEPPKSVAFENITRKD